MDNPDSKPSLKTILSRENPFRALWAMVLSIVGKIPAHLVVILAISLVLTTLMGFYFKFSVYRPVAVYLPQRVDTKLTEQEADKVINERVLRGVWVREVDGQIYVLKLGGGVFEIVLRDPTAPSFRYYARGGYRLVGDVLIMQQREDLGSPLDMDRLNIKYYPMQFATVNLFAKVDGRLLTMNVPKSEISRINNSDIDIRNLLLSAPVWTQISHNPK